MLLLNTTFYVEQSLSETFVNWAKTVYAPAMLQSAGLSSPLLSRLMIEVEEGMEGYAFQVQCASPEAASEWHDGIGAELRDTFAAAHTNKVLHFTTYMEVIPL